MLCGYSQSTFFLEFLKRSFFKHKIIGLFTIRSHFYPQTFSFSTMLSTDLYFIYSILPLVSRLFRCSIYRIMPQFAYSKIDNEGGRN